MWLCVGLGNPGPQYEGNRHNLGFQVVGELARRAGAGPLRGKFGAELGEASLGGLKVLLCKPMEFMNVSGQSVSRVARFFKVAPADVIVVHDDLDLPFARLKLAAGGGHGGHNGLRSMIAELGTADFARVRVGIGRPAEGRDPADYVLGDFSRLEQKEVPFMTGEAADAVEAVVSQGLTAAMNKFNRKKKDDGGAA